MVLWIRNAFGPIWNFESSRSLAWIPLIRGDMQIYHRRSPCSPSPTEARTQTNIRIARQTDGRIPSMIMRLVRVREVAGSNPVAPI